MDYEALITVIDESDLVSGHKRKKEGDIIAIREKGFSWGRKELDEYIVIPFSSGDDINTLRERYENIKAADGSKNKYQISFDTIKAGFIELDLTKVRNKKYKYQPFLQASKCIEKFTDMTIQDIDCGIQPEKYISLNDTFEGMIIDKDA